MRSITWGNEHSFLPIDIQDEYLLIAPTDDLAFGDLDLVAHETLPSGLKSPPKADNASPNIVRPPV